MKLSRPSVVERRLRTSLERLAEINQQRRVLDRLARIKQRSNLTLFYVLQSGILIILVYLFGIKVILDQWPDCTKYEGSKGANATNSLHITSTVNFYVSVASLLIAAILSPFFKLVIPQDTTDTNDTSMHAKLLSIFQQVLSVCEVSLLPCQIALASIILYLANQPDLKSCFTQEQVSS